MPDSARFGPYRLQGEIGRGAMGVVYRAYDERHARVVALKVLAPDISSDAEYRRRFEQESHIVAALTDPHVIPIHSYGEIDGRLYLDMRLVEGRSVKQWLHDSGPMTPAQAVSIVSQVADALDSAHAVGVIHRDVKPSNVLIARHVATRQSREEFAYLVDFGIARSRGGTDLTSVGFTVGTIDYMAPERFDGQHSGIGADVYALGCLLAECLTGRKPFPGTEVGQVVRGHLHSPPPRPSQLVPGVPPGLDAVVARALAKDPARRYRSAGELADEARAALSPGVSGLPPARPPQPGPPPTAPPASGPLGSGPRPIVAPAWTPPVAPVGIGAGMQPFPEPGGGRRDSRVVLTAVCAAIVIVVAAVVAVVVHNKNVASCAAGSGRVIACGAPIDSGSTANHATTPSGTTALSAEEKSARAAIGATAKCTSVPITSAPSAQASFVDAGVSCEQTIPGVSLLYAFHLKSAAATTSAYGALNDAGNPDDFGYDSVIDTTTGKIAQGNWAVSFATEPELVLVWPHWQVEVVAVGTGAVTSASALLAKLRAVSWQYGTFGGAPDYGSQDTLRSYTKLACTPHRLEEIPAVEYQVNVAWLVCSPPTGLSTFTSIDLFRVDSAAHALGDLKRETDSGYVTLTNLKGVGKAIGKCVISNDPTAGLTSIFCQYPPVAGYDQIHLESQLVTTMSLAATRAFFKTHSIEMASMFDKR